MSAVFFGGAPLEILRAWQRGRVTLLASAAIFEEYYRVVDELGRRYGVGKTRMRPLPGQTGPIITTSLGRDEEGEGHDEQGRSGFR